MIINNFNGEIICTKCVNIHDDIIKYIKYDFLNSKLRLSIMANDTEMHEYSIVFVNVVGFELTSCDYWGHSPHILDFEYVSCDKRILLPKLTGNMESNPLNSNCKLLSNIEYIETVVTFTSGDKLMIACEYIEYNKNQFN